MILAIDIGNTTVALGGIRDGRVCFVARMDTVRTRTAAEYRVEMDKIFAHRRHPERPMRFEGAVLRSPGHWLSAPAIIRAGSRSSSRRRSEPD